MLQYNAKLISNTAPNALLIHGHLGDFTVMKIFERCLPKNWNIFYPQAPIELEPGKFSWWSKDNSGSLAEKATFAAKQVKDLLELIIKQNNLTNSFKVCFGFSQGACLASVLAQVFPELIKKYALLCGFAVKLDQQVHGLPNFFIYNGINDKVVTIDRARDSRDYLSKLGSKVEYLEELIGHKVGAVGMKRLKEWVDNFYPS